RLTAEERPGLSGDLAAIRSAAPPALRLRHRNAELILARLDFEAQPRRLVFRELAIDRRRHALRKLVLAQGNGHDDPLVMAGHRPVAFPRAAPTEGAVLDCPLHRDELAVDRGFPDHIARF